MRRTRKRLATPQALRAFWASNGSSAAAGWQRNTYGSSDSGGAERFSSGSSGPAPASRTSVASISVTVSTTVVLGGFLARTFVRAVFAPPLSLVLAGRLRGVVRATVRFAGFFRAALEGLRALRRVIKFRFRTAGRFFR